MSGSEYADVLAWLYALDAAKGMDFKLERVALGEHVRGGIRLGWASSLALHTNGPQDSTMFC
jgi:hypothetical protein